MTFSAHPLAKLTLIASVAALYACSGGGGGGAGTASSSTVTTGIVAGGAPVANGSGYVLDASAASATSGKTTFTTDSNGAFSVDLSGKNGPFLYHLNGVTSGGSPVDLYSIANASQAAGRINITPLTSLVTGYASGSSGAQLESTCTATWANCATLLNNVLQNVSSATSTVMSAVPANIYTQFGLSSGTFNPFTTSFSANHTGADALLDAITVSPPATNGGNFTVTLNSTGTSILTVPTTGTPGTKSSSTPTSSTPTNSELTQSANIAKALQQIETRISAFNALFATTLPSASAIQAFLDAGFMYDSANATDFSNGIINSTLKDYFAPVGTKFVIGGLAPYSGAPYSGSNPAANLVFDGNNCATEVWVYSGRNGFITGMMKMVNAAPGASCDSGSWMLAGNGRQFATAYIAPSFLRFQLPTPQYRSGLNLITLTSQSALNLYAKINIAGPGITTKGAEGATSGSVDIVPADTSLNSHNVINNAFYGSASANPYTGLLEGTEQILDCGSMNVGQTTNGNWNVAATTNTPCLNTSAAKAGSDYVITVKDSGGTTLEKFNQRLAVAPSTTIPTSWYPTITSVSPAGNTITGSGGSANFQWTLPSGSQSMQVSTNINDIGIRTLRNIWKPVGSAATSATLTIGSLPTHAGLPGVPDVNTSYGMVSATLNGLMITSAMPY
jgi:hypothetical protein